MVSGNKTEDNLNNHFKQFDELSSDQNRNSNNTANCKLYDIYDSHHALFQNCRRTRISHELS